MPHFPFGFGRKRKKNSMKKENIGGEENGAEAARDSDRNSPSYYEDEFSLGSTAHFRWYAGGAGRGSVRGAEWITRNAVPYLEAAYGVYRDQVLKVGDLVRLPVRVEVKPSDQCSGGIAGATGEGNLSYCAGDWGSNQFCYGIVTHELCNLFTGECVSAGWPTAWWANHRSPFPTVIANEVMKVLVPRFYRSWGDYNDPLVVMFDQLYRTYRGMFPRMLQKMRELRISLSGLEDPYLSQVVYYFMFYGAQRALGRYFVSPPMPPIDLLAFQKLESDFHLGVPGLPAD
jgi:hypothetical protein